nr:hypothetical protein BgiMline_012173 [Biomphalaria glabrata]
MSAFAASYIAANDHDDDRHQHHHQVLDEGKMTWWQKLQYRYNCCLIDWLVLCFCKQEGHSTNMLTHEHKRGLHINIEETYTSTNDAYTPIRIVHFNGEHAYM